MNYSDKPQGFIFTDFDGTLFNHKRFITDDNYTALETARTAGYLTAINTGRSLFSFKRAAAKLEKPISDYIDFLIFSSGVGVLRLCDDKLEETENLMAADAFEAAGLFFKHGIDFMLQKEVPHNHHFVHVKSNGSVNPDFYRRIKIYEDFAEGLSPKEEESDLDSIEKVCYEGVSQLVGIIPPSIKDDEKYASELIEYLRYRLSSCSIVRTTSPIDHKSLWVEIFSPDVSKAKTAARLAERHGLNAETSLAIGNDFNDEDLLRWAGTARTVDEAPESLKQMYPSAGRSIDSAVANAIREFSS